jgi:hypothetical protein
VVRLGRALALIASAIPAAAASCALIADIQDVERADGGSSAGGHDAGDGGHDAGEDGSDGGSPCPGPGIVPCEGGSCVVLTTPDASVRGIAAYEGAIAVAGPKVVAEIVPGEASLPTHLWTGALDPAEVHQRLGEATARRSDLRVVAAINRPEEDLKPDLRARLTLRLLLPGLDARREDIPLLAVHLLRRHAAADPVLADRFFPGGDPRGVPRLSPVLVRALVTHRYTTHVRELDAILLRAALGGCGRYVELSPDLAGDLAIDRAPARPPSQPSSAPASAPSTWSGDEQARLGLLRKHGFRPSACGRDPEYPGNRQTADLHLRQLVCRALALGGWDVDRAAALLAGAAQGALRDKVKVRIATFLGHLKARLADEADLRRSLSEEWKASAGIALDVVEAIRAGRIREGS